MELNPILSPGDYPQPAIWYVISSMGHHPTVRVGHTCLYTPSRRGRPKGELMVIGGADPNGAFSDTYFLNLDTYQWSMPDFPGLRPRYEHAVFQPVSQPGKIFVFGGADQGRNMNDLQVLDLNERKWSSSSVTGTPPSERTCRNSASAGDSLYVFGGGYQGAEPVSDRNLYVFDSERMEWTCPVTKGKKPTCRHGHVMVAVANKIYLHGGMSQDRFYSDLHEFDTETLTWKEVRCKGDIPIGCTGHGAVAVGDKIVTFGGLTHNGALDATYIFNTKTSRWHLVSLECAPPACRLDFGMCVARLPYDRPPTTDLSTSNPGGGQSQPVTDSGQDGKIVTVLGGDRQGRTVESDGGASTVHRLQNISNCPDEPETKDDASAPEGASASAADVGTVNSAEDGTVKERSCLVLVVHGGMDTEGEIFNDCLVLRLDSLL